MHALVANMRSCISGSTSLISILFSVNRDYKKRQRESGAVELLKRPYLCVMKNSVGKTMKSHTQKDAHNGTPLLSGGLPCAAYISSETTSMM